MKTNGPFNLDSHVGMLEIGIDFQGLHPAILGAVPPATNVTEWLASLNKDLEAVFAKHFIDYSVALDKPIAQIAFNREPSVILPKDERDAERDSLLKELREIFQAGDDARMQRLASDPNNGKDGFWEVVGVWHDAIVRASSAIEAVQKAIDAQSVGDWESPEAAFIGETMPEVV